MTPERFRQIEELYHAAREGTAEERAALFAQADPELRREVESLLQDHAGAGFLDGPALQNAVGSPQDLTVTTLEADTMLGPYRIESTLGEGGMGKVFRAIDTRLGRAVAVKTAHEQFSDRFDREARAIAALNHPNICTLYDVGPNYLVMELVEGETLAERLKRGPVPMKEALLHASQIAAALGEAHLKGIVHRDLKPGNIMLGKSGVKVMDFGLAKTCQDETITVSRMVVGTPAYMSPEQREGRRADTRSDIYSFGCVLHEMLTGEKATAGRGRSPSGKLEAIVSRCLEVDPERRWQSVAELSEALEGFTPPGRVMRLAAGAAAIVALCTAGYLYLHRPPKLTAKDTIVLGDFENKTGDAIFDKTLRQGLAVQLEQSPFLALVPDQSIQRVLGLMKRPAGTQLTPEVSREICARSGGSAVLDGSIASLGSQYVLWLRARNCATGEVLAEEQSQAERKEEVLNALSRMAVRMRMRLGESRASLQAHSKPLEQATTASLEALQSYSLATSVSVARGGPSAIPHLKQAIALDPEFAMAHAYLGFMLWNMGQTDLGAEEVRVAYKLKDRVSDRERRYIDMLYHRQVTGNMQKLFQALESWAQAYPRDVHPRGILGGWVAFSTGNYEMGLKASQQAIQLDPDMSPPYFGIALHNLFLDRYAEAADAVRVSAERRLESPELLVISFYLAFLKGDQDGMDREIARASQMRMEDQMSHHQALVYARSGRMRRARTLWEHAITLAQQAEKQEAAALYTAAAAVCEARFGNATSAKERARAALKLARGRDVEYAAAFALARSGELAEAQRLAADLDRRFPEDTPVQFEYLPILRGLSALARRAPLEAIQGLQTSIPYDFALPGTAFFGRFGGLYSVYMRGEAFLAAGRGREAASEFQKVLTRRGIVLADPIGALAHLQLGRAYTVSGDMMKARTSYQSFFDLWKDADQEIPILKQARAEYAKL